ncbi:MAG TPA: nodulation protein NfeD [Terriglobales bacterium]|nr:nodulation protein NfeD [Terriglobales bacterium]
MSSRWPKRILFGAAALLLCCASAASAQVLKIVLDDTIQPISDEFIDRTLQKADQEKDQAVLIQLSTPGGLADSTRHIIEKIVASPVPVIIYVAPSGSRAASAGFFILEAADVAVMAPGTNTGAAHPVTLMGPKMDDIMKTKVENDAAALMRSIVAKRGRNVEVAESAVRQSKSWTEGEALSQHLIDYVASSQDDLFKQLQGKPIRRFNGQTVTLDLVGKPVRPFEMSLKQRILNYIMDPNIAFILLAIGALALYAEFNHPGAVVPGVIGVIFILLAAFALNLLPTRYAALVLILASFVMFALEAKFATHGVLGIGGIALLTLGALLLVDGPIPELRVNLLTALAVSIPLGLITVFLMDIALRARRGKVVTGAQGLVGEIGTARTPLGPEGKVFIHGELWDAVASGSIEAGQAVVVKRIDGLRLEVEPVRAGQPSTASAPL